MTLAETRGGDRFRIEAITLKGEIGKRLVDMGLNQGVEGEVLRCAFFGDPIELRIRDYNVSLRKSEAAGIDVVITERGCGRGHGRGRGALARRGKGRGGNRGIEGETK